MDIELTRAMASVFMWSLAASVLGLLISWYFLATAIRWGVSKAITDTRPRLSEKGGSGEPMKEAPPGFRWVLVREETAKKLAGIHDIRAD